MPEVLVAADAQWVLDEVGAVLSGPDDVLTVVNAGALVLPAVERYDPDLVILDLQIGNMGAMASCMELRLEESADRRRVPGPQVRGGGLAGQAARPEAAAQGDPGAARRWQVRGPVLPAADGRRPGRHRRRARLSRVRLRRRWGRNAASRPGRDGAAPLPAGDGGSGPAEPDASAAAEEARIRSALVSLRETVAKEVMTPRVDVVALETPVSPTDVAQAVKESGHSRFPVYEEDLDQLVGVLFVKDLFRMGNWPAGVTTESIARRLRPPFLVPEGRGVLELLAEMRSDRHAFAVILDEYGGVEGVLTIKDLVSELVGDLRDEFDQPEEEPVNPIDTERWLVDGAAPVEDVSAALGIALPEGDYVTIGGFLFERFGRIPEEGDAYLWHGWDFRIAEMDKRRISKVVVRAPAATMGAGPVRATGK